MGDKEFANASLPDYNYQKEPCGDCSILKSEIAELKIKLKSTCQNVLAMHFTVLNLVNSSYNNEELAAIQSSSQYRRDEALKILYGLDC